MCYTYDSLSRVTARTVKKLSDNSVVSTETFNYDAAGNVTSAPDSSFQYDTNNRLISFNGNTVSYDLDGNMLSNGSLTCTYDSANRLVSAGGHTYTYNAEDVRIRNLCAEEDTAYTYNTNAKLSMLLMKTTNGVVTKYVYGKGLIGEEVSGVFKTYHFDCRGSTIAITDASGNITDTFAYDTYGKLISRTGTNKVIFGYNGRDGVVTDDNGLIYMRARYYSPEMKRFINADIVSGKLSNAITLNRFAYANGNPVSFVDPFGLSAARGANSNDITYNFTKAILVSNFNYNFPINYTGHTQLYFCDENSGIWYLTEFNSYQGEEIKEIKSYAQIYWKEAETPPGYDPNTGVITSVNGINYVVLEGDFNKSAALAQKYYEKQNFGRYNFLFNNCSDYTNEILEHANIDGMFSQVLGKVNSLISIPAVREMLFSTTNYIDSFPEAVISKGKNLKDSDTVFGKIAGTALVGTGEFIDGVANFVGDVTGAVVGTKDAVVDFTKKGAAVITNAVADVAQAVWNRISFWD